MKMVRAPSYDEKGLKRGAWSVEEDEQLRNCVLIYGTTTNWGQLPNLAGLNRCGKSCRLRWMNYLRPDLKHGNFTQQEDHLILQLHQQYGNKWSVIAAALPGRTDNEIKNHWHTSLRKLIRRHGTENKLDPGDHHQTVELSSSTRSDSTYCSVLCADDLPHPILESSLLSPAETISSYAASSSSSSSSTSNYTSTPHPGGPVTSTTDPRDSWQPEMQLVYGDEDFWTQPFLMETSSSNSDLLPRFDDPVDLFYMQDQFPFM